MSSIPDPSTMTNWELVRYALREAAVHGDLHPDTERYQTELDRRLAHPTALRAQIADEIRGMDAKALYDVFWKAKPNGATSFEEWRCKQIAAMAETIAQSVEGQTAVVAAVLEDA